MKQDKSPKKQPLQNRSKQTVDAIIGAATHILKKQGVDKLNTNFIAEIAGVSVGSVYQFFKNKDAISDELINRLLDNNLKKIEAIFENEIDKDMNVVIHKMVASLFDSFEHEGPLTTFIMENILKIVGFNRFARMEARMIPFFIEQMKKNQIPFHHPHPELAVKNAIQCVRVLVLSYFLQPKNYNREEMIGEITKVVTSYLYPVKV